MQQLGNHEDNLIFLGYPDSGLKTIYDTYTDARRASTSRRSARV